jgi:EAL domain-containing protein (putative c-di-GMP-specific phosphodiesterase class I)
MARVPAFPTSRSGRSGRPGRSGPLPAGGEHPKGIGDEKRLLHDLKRSASNTRGRWAVHVHLSRLQPRSRPDHALRAAEANFNTLAARDGARFYWLRNNDFMVFFNAPLSDGIRSALVKIRFLFAGDPLVENLQDPGHGQDPLATWHALDKDFDLLMARAQAMVADHPAIGSGPQRPQRRGPVDPQRRGAPLTPSMLARVETALSSADLSSHIRRQAICAVVGRASPDPVFTEVFVSIGDLREALIPHIDLASNPWLFQHLTQTLDRRVLAMLTRRDDKTLAEGFSINLNVQTILSEDFLRFDDSLAPGSHGTVVLELRPEDIFSDLNAFFFARDFVRQRGYRVCIDGLTWRTLPFIDPQRLGVDLVKLMWSDDLPETLNDSDGHLARQAIERGVHGRLILARCDDERAIRLGQSLGITLFQGRHLDKVMRPILY